MAISVSERVSLWLTAIGMFLVPHPVMLSVCRVFHRIRLSLSYSPGRTARQLRRDYAILSNKMGSSRTRLFGKFMPFHIRTAEFRQRQWHSRNDRKVKFSHRTRNIMTLDPQKHVHLATSCEIILVASPF